MKVVYTAGPYRGQTFGDVCLNIFRAWEAAHALWSRGYAPICPHTNSIFMSEGATALPANLFLEADLEFVRRSDAILMLPGWENSVGARGELEEAKLHNIPIFFSLEELDEWRRNQA